MKIISWNVNGLRSIYKKDFLGWLEETRADLVCLQEIKVQEKQLPLDLIKPKNYYSYFNSAQRKGYSGVAVYSEKKPLEVKKELGMERFDKEGRMLKLKYPDFILINLYMPHGGRLKEHLDYKLKTYACLFENLRKIKHRKVIIIGDFNIAHKDIDLARPKQNRNNIMFTPKEREQIDKLLNLGFIDTFRKFHKRRENYTWWPYFAKARQRNLGWRIDYAFISKRLTPKLKNAFILPKVTGSDHCPIGIEI
jgi:exodeoxyribonuclease-3